MKDDYARATGQPRPITLDGRQYLVGKLRPRDLGTLQAWFKRVVPSPLDEARRRMDGLPDAVQIHLWDRAVEAARDWPPQFGSEQATGLLMSPEGQAEFLHIVLSRHNAGVTPETAQALAERIELDEFVAVMDAAAPGELGDPKATAATA